MNPLASIEADLRQALRRLAEAGRLPDGLDLDRAGVEMTKDPQHGDVATSVAMMLAKPAKMRPLDIATALADELRGRPGFQDVSVAPPGFVNIRMEPAFWQAVVPAIMRAGVDFARADLGQGRHVNVEFCSANPTGPLHVGHARGTVFGDALASILQRVGYRVTREYYVNDAGAQVETLARSLHLRYREVMGEDIGEMPEGFYPGLYLIRTAEALAVRDGDKWLHRDEAEWLEPLKRFAVDAQLEVIKDDLAALGVHHDLFLSERSLIEDGMMQAALERLEGLGLLYVGELPPPKGKPPEDWEPRPQLLFRATQFGDDVDRPLKRSNGAWTYFAADLGCHFSKLQRGHQWLIDVLGADHGGYVKRLKAAVKALSEGRVELEARLCQLVSLMDEGKPLKMSKRAGRIVTMRDVVDEVGKDVMRFMLLTRKNDAPLEFDLAKVVEQSRDNPVFYVQYAHARVRSVFRQAEQRGLGHLATDLGASDLSLLTHPAELDLLKKAALLPRVLEQAAMHAEPHRIAFWLTDVASELHGLWTKGSEDETLRFLVEGEPERSRARLAMLEAARMAIAAGLDILGVTPVDELR
ncbi:MAG TPA: arginine--tRNA ligase [Geminicoccus sp.]|jgi:arginyl-tRNA synthetase|uniref:arginine--tRNA ligase n=1 Tax=Geminicoccus sp. TaxID=2024832 RepID=UPI002E318BBD|nr:arginine--tRNA ligase [Geminicoccus sp.]HEX2529170.1 arginine--tRNA ligase [Geminicoccus sp.]